MSRLLPPPPSSPPPPLHAQEQARLRGNNSLGLDGLSLIDRARALCAAAEDVQRATIEASHRIAAIHGSPQKPKKKKTASQKTADEPPDICARPPSDVPPPRGEGWRRLGPVSVVCGSNRISAPPQSRRALTREVEIFVDGGQYRVVPADIGPGGGFCVSLDRDFEGETNMACMLYLRQKMGAVKIAARKASKAAEMERTVLPQSKVVESSPLLPPPSAAAPAPFSSVGETPTVRATSPSPFSIGMERELDTFVMSRPDGTRDGANTTAVRAAQRRARQRALSQRKLEAAADKKALNASEKPPTASDMQRLKASRRAALARVAVIKQKEASLKQESTRNIEQQRRQKENDAVLKVDASRAAAVARAGRVAAGKRQRERELDLARQAEARAKQERVAAVLAYDEAKADEREKQVRNETYRRIQRKERHRELALQQEEDERMDRMRLYEGGEGHAVPPFPPAVQSARSFFSIEGPVSVSDKVEGENGPTTASSTPGAEHCKQHDLVGAHSGGPHPAQGSHDARCHQPLEKRTGMSRRRRSAADVRGVAEGEFLSKSTSNFDSRAEPEGGTIGICSGRKSKLGADDNDRRRIRGAVRIPVLLSPTLTSSSGGAGSASTTGTSKGSGSSSKPNRKRITATPVWKRPVVPLSKPYVPVPRKNNGRFAA